MPLREKGLRPFFFITKITTPTGIGVVKLVDILSLCVYTAFMQIIKSTEGFNVVKGGVVMARFRGVGAKRRALLYCKGR